LVRRRDKMQKADYKRPDLEEIDKKCRTKLESKLARRTEEIEKKKIKKKEIEKTEKKKNQDAQYSILRNQKK
jgi:hypothetical protein